MADVQAPGNVGPPAEPRQPDAPPLGVVMREPLPWDELVRVVRTAEETGYGAVFVPESSGREAFSTLAGFAVATDSMLLGTGVVTIQARTPAATAMGAGTVHDMSGGRMVLGIGAGSQAASAGPIDRVRSYVRAVRALLGGAATHEPTGERDLRLDLPARSGPVPRVLLGALGDRMVELGGEIGDGVLLNLCPPERVASARQILSEAGDRVGRDPGSVMIAVYVRACLGVDEGIAIRALKEVTGRYAAIRHYLRQLEAVGLGDEGRAAAEAFGAGRVEDVPESLVRAVAVVGARSAALGRFGEYFSAGADMVLCYPVPALDAYSSIMGTVLAAAPSPAVER